MRDISDIRRMVKGSFRRRCRDLFLLGTLTDVSGYEYKLYGANGSDGYVMGLVLYDEENDVTEVIE